MASKGEAHLIGNGYSLTADTLDSLRGKTTFALNGIALMYRRTSWRPMFYFMVSTRYNGDRDFMSHVRVAVAECQTAYIDRYFDCKEEFNSRANVIFLNTSEELFWSDTLDKVSKFSTGMLTMLQIAVMLGYSPLYLYGVDGYRAGACNHFCPEYFRGDVVNVDKEQENMRHAFEFVKENCPVQIIDRTASAGFGIFERES